MEAVLVLEDRDTAVPSIAHEDSSFRVVILLLQCRNEATGGNTS